MLITVQQEEKEILVHTVSLHKNMKSPTNLYLFRCPYCSTGIVQIQGIVNKIMPGLEPTEEVVVIHQCKSCKRLYTFQTLEYLNKTETKVTLVNTPNNLSVFHCYICRNPVLQFKGDKIIKLPNFELIPLPSSVNCSNPTCDAKYYVVDVI